MLLGPQRHRPILRAVLDELAVPAGTAGPVAVVTSGWEERETETDELAAHVDRPITLLELFTRAERILADDPELAAAWRRRRLAWRRLARLHRVRVNAAIDVVRALLAEPASDVRDAEVADAVAHVAALDERHASRIAELLATFDARWLPADPAAPGRTTRPSVRREQDEVHARLDASAALLVAGGDVGVLHRTLRLFGLAGRDDGARTRPVIAWSAGAMALTDRIVLFHDRPPQGFTHAEVHGPGTGRVRGIVALPHAQRRLLLDDHARVALLAGRTAPAVAIAMDEGARIDVEGDRIVRAGEIAVLVADGTVRPVGANDAPLPLIGSTTA